jgi:hypothetical protein
MPHARERILPTGTMQLLVNIYEDELRTYGGEGFASLERIRGAAFSGTGREGAADSPNKRSSQNPFGVPIRCSRSTPSSPRSAWRARSR